VGGEISIAVSDSPSGQTLVRGSSATIWTIDDKSRRLDTAFHLC
jgi:hypothetical protein